MSTTIVKIRSFVTRAKRLMRHAKRPSGRELSVTAKITSVGILLIGTIGYVLNLIFSTLIDAINRARR